MKRHEALSVGQIIDTALSQTGNRDEFERQQACYMWQEVVGPAINRFTVRRWIERDTMHVVIASASVKNELMFRREALANAINLAVGKKVIERIIIH